MSFKEKRILMNKFVESQFEVLLVYEFQTKVYSYEDICWTLVWSHVVLWVSNESEFLWRYLLSLGLKLFKFTCFNQNLIPLRTFVESQLELMYLQKFQRKAISNESICWVSVWSYLSLRLSSKTEFLWRHFLSFSLKLSKFTSFKQKRILMKTFLESQSEIMSVH